MSFFQKSFKKEKEGRLPRYGIYKIYQESKEKRNPDQILRRETVTLPRQKMMFTGAEEKTEHKTGTNSRITTNFSTAKFRTLE